MRRDTAEDDKKLTLRISPDLWRRVRIESAYRDLSATAMINELLDERLGQIEAERQAPRPPSLDNP